MNIIPLAVIWAVLATVVLALALYRRSISAKEDDYIHVDSNVVAQQQEYNKKLAVIDRWGKILTIVAVAFALVLFMLFLYNGWQSGGKLSY